MFDMKSFEGIIASSDALKAAIAAGDINHSSTFADIRKVLNIDPSVADVTILRTLPDADCLAGEVAKVSARSEEGYRWVRRKDGSWDAWDRDWEEVKMTVPEHPAEARAAIAIAFRTGMRAGTKRGEEQKQQEVREVLGL